MWGTSGFRKLQNKKKLLRRISFQRLEDFNSDYPDFNFMGANNGEKTMRIMKYT